MLPNQITAAELALLYAQASDFVLVDVREVAEYQRAHMNGLLIPLAELAQCYQELPKDKVIVIHCHSGYRSQLALEFLQQQGFTHVKNLTGGILAWQAYQALDD